MCSTDTGLAPETTGGTSVCTWAADSAPTAIQSPSAVKENNSAIFIGASVWNDRVLSSSKVLLEKPGRKVLEIAPPRLPLVRCAGRLVKDMLDLRVLQRSVQPLQSILHAGRLFCSHA